MEPCRIRRVRRTDCGQCIDCGAEDDQACRGDPQAARIAIATASMDKLARPDRNPLVVPTLLKKLIQ